MHHQRQRQHQRPGHCVNQHMGNVRRLLVHDHQRRVRKNHPLHTNQMAIIIGVRSEMAAHIPDTTGGRQRNGHIHRRRHRHPNQIPHHHYQHESTAQQHEHNHVRLHRRRHRRRPHHRRHLRR